MPTIDEVLRDVHEDKNAISAFNKGIDAAEAFAQTASDKFDSDHPEEAGQPIANLVYLLKELRKAVPANVVPSTAGPVGKSPHEQYLEQASGIVHESLKRMQEVLAPVEDLLKTINAAVQHVNLATSALKSPDLN